MSPHQRVLSFRLDAATVATLDNRAKARTTTPSTLAREIVVSTLRGETNAHEELAMEVSALRHEVSELRRDLAVAVEALLVLSGKVSKDDAYAWTQENLRK